MSDTYGRHHTEAEVWRSGETFHYQMGRCICNFINSGLEDSAWITNPDYVGKHRRLDSNWLNEDRQAGHVVMDGNNWYRPRNDFRLINESQNPYWEQVS